MKTEYNPLIIQDDLSVLLDMNSPLAEESSAGLAQFAELAKSPGSMHTYRITPLSIWNARAAGLLASDMTSVITRYSQAPPPEGVLCKITDIADRYGKIRLERNNSGLRLTVSDQETAALLLADEAVALYVTPSRKNLSFHVAPEHRGVLKQALVAAGYPASDRAGFEDGEPLDIQLRKHTLSRKPFQIRDYQKQAVEAFYQSGALSGGSGIVCLPCGGGKTIVGLGAMAELGQTTLVLTTSGTSIAQWRREILDKTNIPEGHIAEYTGKSKDIGPVTLSTYQILTWRPDKESEFEHFRLFKERSWGLIIYDEVHLLPAPIFRVTAELQGRRRLGMTATLIREDGREGDVFALIGPKRYQMPWKDMESDGWIAKAECTEIRVPLPEDLWGQYVCTPRRAQTRLAAENPEKLKVLKDLLKRHPRSKLLIIGEYISQLEQLADELGFPLVTGKTPPHHREAIYGQFRSGTIRHLILSRIGNFALDLPDADVMVQVSGMFGSRQEEAQRLGRILRPKMDGRLASFYTIVTRNTREEDFARKRQLFLVEQGYSYKLQIEDYRWEGNP